MGAVDTMRGRDNMCTKLLVLLLLVGASHSSASDSYFPPEADYEPPFYNAHLIQEPSAHAPTYVPPATHYQTPKYEAEPPVPTYGAPIYEAPRYEEPQEYHEREPKYIVPRPKYHAPEPKYEAPKPKYHAPEPKYEAPKPK